MGQRTVWFLTGSIGAFVLALQIALVFTVSALVLEPSTGHTRETMPKATYAPTAPSPSSKTYSTPAPTRTPTPTPTVDELAIAREQCVARNAERDTKRQNVMFELQDSQTQLTIVQREYEQADDAYSDAILYGSLSDEVAAGAVRSRLNGERILLQYRVTSNTEALNKIDASYENCNF